MRKKCVFARKLVTIVVPCRMCQAGPGDPCKYKGRTIGEFHYKRESDAAVTRALITGESR